MRFGTFLRNLIVLLVVLLVLGSASMTPGDKVEEIRQYTRSIEFDYVTWTLDALMLKITQAAVGAPRYMTDTNQEKVVNTNIALVDEINRANASITRTYANPNVPDPAKAVVGDVKRLDQLIAIQNQIQPVSESVLQQQVSSILSAQGLTLGGQPIPPVMFHGTPLPMALIISPRNVIEQEANISLEANLTLPEMIQLENEVEKNKNVSALVVPVGGVGVYPTMVMNTTDLSWLAEVISHEWTHNYLTLRPLGVNYETTPELRTMNETTASIVGKEIGSIVIQRFYPELLPPPEPTAKPQTSAPQSEPTPNPNEPPPFNFNKEMHETRVTADKLLSEGKIDQAEAYMEARRVVFWEHGYQIRKLNQAYFAFYGAYADVPGGAAGQDPVGPAVRELRARSKSLADFLNRISWMTSFQQLQDAVK